MKTPMREILTAHVAMEILTIVKVRNAKLWDTAPPVLFDSSFENDLIILIILYSHSYQLKFIIKKVKKNLQT